MKRFKIKYLKSIGKYVLHTHVRIQPPGKRGRWYWRRVWGYEFHTESMARKFAEGRF